MIDQHLIFTEHRHILGRKMSWSVLMPTDNPKSPHLIGEVRWHGDLVCYAWHQAPDTSLTVNGLREIVEFLEHTHG